jgi:Clr5 domain
VASARNKNVCASNSVERENSRIFDDAVSKESFHEPSPSTMELNSPRQERDQANRQITSKHFGLKNLRWESMKQDINMLYMIEANTLDQTMEKIEQAHAFKAS